LRSDVLELRLPVGPLGTGFELFGIDMQGVEAGLRALSQVSTTWNR
jgi:hypothetical protein